MGQSQARLSGRQGRTGSNAICTQDWSVVPPARPSLLGWMQCWFWACQLCLSERRGGHLFSRPPPSPTQGVLLTALGRWHVRQGLGQALGWE